jgi:hypothetical protein
MQRVTPPFAGAWDLPTRLPMCKRWQYGIMWGRAWHGRQLTSKIASKIVSNIGKIKSVLVRSASEEFS